jgi:hypothetical protein
VLTKNKKPQTKTNRLSHAAAQAGYLLMAGIATIGMTDTLDHLNNRVVVPGQPVFAYENVGPEPNDQGNNSMRREREDLESHYISYSVVQRTARRTGRR